MSSLPLHPPEAGPPAPPAGRRPQVSSRGRGLPPAPVTYAVIGVCVAIWLLTLLAPDTVTRMFGFVPYWAGSEPWTSLTMAFVHSPTNSLHVVFNMLGLFFFGTFLERWLGSARFALLYLLSAFGASLTVFAVAIASSSPTPVMTMHIGASGALFGLVGFVATPTRRLDRNLSGVIGFVVVNIVLLWFVPNISWQAHLGGFLTGFVFGCVYFFTPQRLRALGLLILTVVVAAVGFAALVLVPVTV